MVTDQNDAVIIKKIENYGARYDPSSGLSPEDQLLACEAVAEAIPVKERYYQENERTNDNAVVSGMINGSYKRRANFELTQSRLKVIDELKTFNYRTAPNKIAPVLEYFFKECDSKEGHWLYIAQHYPPRVIFRVINYLIKLHNSGRSTILNPAAYFTKLIKFRKERKEFRVINGSRKQHI